LNASETEDMPLEKRSSMAVAIDRRDLPNRVRTSFTSVGSEADSPELLLRSPPVTDHDAETLDVSDLDFGYDAENFP
jgi:hypothetical protein